ncbi:hypothetical protein PNOK_0019400 [Pyrrhoderma noxium]|uniref:Uncharacterized protein n=1 Tax=Pyrrhoderma noxium TaxID=2282107 RepID=A0A286UU47_9AGAM|nr:hypothetical protein PNOK_0019400 [Pyrrhoderma noxium]
MRVKTCNDRVLETFRRGGITKAVFATPVSMRKSVLHHVKFDFYFPSTTVDLGYGMKPSNVQPIEYVKPVSSTICATVR